MTISTLDLPKRTNFYKWAYALALITIFYNIVEGLVSVFFGFEDETVSLFGFGIDSFVEVISGIGIWHMVRRIRENGNESPDRFERRALMVTGTAFYLLTGGLILTAIFNLYYGHAPITTFWGIVISLISIISMWALIHFKEKVGQSLNSQAILTDAACTKACLKLSVVLLLASVGYELTGIGGLDSIGAILIAWLSFKEGREAFEKSQGTVMACGCKGSCN
jgi:divalent metal cation (Fe/Co/Zn/Cd) transporter